MGVALPQGSVVGRWQILATLGVGGMGAVYHVRDQAGREAALKLLIPDASEKAYERFRREIETASSVHHPNVIRVLEWGKHGDIPFLVLELCRGGSLKELARARGGLPWREAVTLTIEVASGLAAIHGARLIHRDLKPENVLLEDGHAKITDFGIARHEATGLTQGGLTKTGELVGTLEYIAPEQCESARLVDSRADLYSLGGLIFFLLTGRPPFEGKGITLVTQHLQSKPRTPQSLGVKVPRALESLLLDLLAKDPVARPKTADEVASRLEEMLDATEETKARSPAGLALKALSSLVVIGAACGLSYAFHGSGTAPPVPPPKRPVSPTPPPPPPPPSPLPLPPECAEFRASANGLMKLSWAAGRYRDRHKKKGGGDTPINVVDVSDDGKRWLSVGEKLYGDRPGDGSVALWDAEKRTLVRLYDPDKPGSEATAAAFISPSLAAITFFDGTAQVWDLDKKAPVTVLGSHELRAISVAVSPDKRRVVTTGWDRTARVWDVSPARLEALGEKQLVSIPHEGGTPNRALFLPDGRRLVTICDDGKVRIWDWEAKVVLRTFDATDEARSDNTPALALSPDGKLVATGHHKEGKIRVWDIEHSDASVPVKVFDTDVWYWGLHSLAFVRGGKALACVTPDAKPAGLDIFDLAGGPKRFIPSLSGALHAVAALKDGRAVCGDEHGALPIFDTEKGIEVEDAHFLNVAGVAYGPGDTVVSAAMDGAIRTWGPNGEPVACVNGPDARDRIPGKLLSFALQPSSSRALASFDSHRLVLVDTRKGDTLAFPPEDDDVSAVSWTPDAARFLEATMKGLDLCEAATGASVVNSRFWISANPRSKPVRAFCLEFSPSGKMFVASGEHACLYVYQAGKSEPSLYIHADERTPAAVRAPAFLIDDTHVVWGGQDGALRVNEIPKGPKGTIAIPTGTKRAIVAIASLRGGTRALLGYDDGKVSIFDLVEKKELDSLSVAAGQSAEAREHPCAFAIAPDERSFVVGTKRGVILRFELGK